VLVRSVEPGQTVAASLQAPVLFTLAEDLKKMELHVAVDEADVGTVEVGQQATFTVDAFPSRTFAAKITQVHFASSSTKSSTTSSSTGSSSTSTGVVTYETVLEVDNSELLLRPGMTATAQIVTTQIDNALLVPNAALRYTPAGASTANQPAADQRGALSSAIMPQMPRRPAANRESRRFGRVWILDGSDPVPVMFKPGATDGRNTQVLDIDPASLAQRGTGQSKDETMQQAFGRKLEPGMAVIVDEAATK
jgi:HlyD family secretion protein